MDNTEKLIYLRSFLRGDALSVIQNLTIIGSNLQIAVDLLEKRYKNTFTIIEAHISNLLENVPTLSKPKAQQLREFVTKIEQNVESLRNLNVPVQHWDLILIHMFIKKLDFPLQKSYFGQRKNTQLPTLNDFLKFLENKCKLLEELNATNSPKPVKKLTHITNINSSNTQNQQNSEQMKCSFCSSVDHSIYKCTLFKKFQIQDRIDFMTNAGLCKLCLVQKHPFSSCHGKNCFKCGKQHNTLLCLNSSLGQNNNNRVNFNENWRSQYNKNQNPRQNFQGSTSGHNSSYLNSRTFDRNYNSGISNSNDSSQNKRSEFPRNETTYQDFRSSQNNCNKSKNN